MKRKRIRALFNRRAGWISVCVFVLIIASCAPSSGPKPAGIFTSTKTNARAVATLKTRVKSYYKVAVLPFKAPVELVGSSVADLWTTEILATGKYEVVERSQMAMVLNEQALGLKGVTDAGDAIKVGQILGVQGVIVGTIQEYGYRAVGGQERPSVGINVRMLDVDDGGVIWSVSNAAIAPTPTSLSAFTQRLVADSIDALKKEWRRVGDTSRASYQPESSSAPVPATPAKRAPEVPRKKPADSKTPVAVRGTAAGATVATKPPKVTEPVVVDSKTLVTIRDDGAGVTVYLRSFLGVHLKDKNKPGPVVTKVRPHSPAAAYGIQVNDIILGIGQIPTPKYQVFSKLKARYAPNQEVVLSILRSGTRRNIPVKLSGQIKQVVPDLHKTQIFLWGKKIDPNIYKISGVGNKSARSDYEVVRISDGADMKQAIKWHYQVKKEGQSADLIISKCKLDLSGFNTLTFKIKAEKPFRFMFNHNKLHCYMWAKATGLEYYKDSDQKKYRGRRHFLSYKFKVTNQWQEIQVPLSAFTGIRPWLKRKIKNKGSGLDPSKIDVIGFSVTARVDNIVYITDIGFRK